MSKRSGVLTGLLIAGLVLVLALPFMPLVAEGSSPAPERRMVLAPANPDFLSFQAKTLARSFSDSDRAVSYGLIPSPLDRSQLVGTGGVAGRRTAQSYSSSFDLRTMGKLTDVRNQNPYGTCWAFASFGSLESSLLPTESWNFSEDNMVNASGFDRDPYNGGGNSDMALAYLARWGGPISEADDPYHSPGVPQGLPVQKHLQQALFYPGRSGPLDNDSAKAAVTTYGAVFTYIYWDDSYYNSGSKAFYYPGSTSTNHAVDIVGWDDNYAASQFTSVPAGNGAFIVRNSWGSGWGDGGYFYISYYDSWVGKELVSFNLAEPVSNFNAIYQYDPLGWTNSGGFGGNTGWFANVFTAASSSSLEAVSFYAARPGSSYTMYVYDRVNGSAFEGLQSSQSGTVDLAGYYTIRLASPVPLAAGEAFVVAIQLTTPGYGYPVPMEYPIPGYSSQATAQSGQSYVSANGTSWTDLTTQSQFSNANVCLKAFATGDTPPPSHSVSITAGPAASPSTIASEGTTNLSVSASDSLGHSLNYSWSVVSSPLGDGLFSSATAQNPTWTAPANSTGSNQTVQLKVQASCSSDSSKVDEGTVNVTVQPNVPPSHSVSITAGPAASPSTIASEGTTNLSVSASDSLGHSLDYNWSVVSSSIGNGSFSSATAQNPSWTAPANSTGVNQTVQLKVQASCSSDSSKFAEGTVNVTVQPQPQPTITVVSPNGGESWMVGESHAIQWSSANLSGNVFIELSRNGGSAWETLFAGTANDGSQSWTVVGVPSDTCRVRVTSVNNETVLDTSNANFHIESSVHEFTLHLVQNWNMISLPLTTSASPTAVFGGLPAGWMIFSWNPLIPGYLMNDQITLETGKGYWLKSPNAMNYEVSGEPFNQLKTVPLAVGWNMVGLPYLEDADWGDVHIRAGGVTYTLDQAADAGVITRYLFWLNGNQYQMANEVGKLEPGKGYWLQTKQACELLFSPGGVTPPPPPPGNP